MRVGKRRASDARNRNAGQACLCTAPETTRRILVVVHMRGACDGLNLVCPANDRNLITARPAELPCFQRGTAPGMRSKPQPRPTSTGGYIRPLRSLRICTSPRPSPSSTRRAFQKRTAATSRRPTSWITARQTARHSLIKGGWLARYLAQSKPKALLPGVSGSGSLAGEFGGLEAAFSVADLANGIPLPWDDRAAAAVERLYKQVSGAPGAAGARALEAAKLVSDKLPRSSDGKYPPISIKRRATTKRAISARGSHRGTPHQARHRPCCRERRCRRLGHDENQQGRFQNNVQRLSGGLSAFWNDIAAWHDKITLLAYSEFGRRLRANKSAGTDHGRGGLMVVMGGGVKGGRILGPWPGLEEGALEERVDLAVKTEYRQVLTELLEYHGGAPVNATVFPGYKPTPRLGLIS